MNEDQLIALYGNLKSAMPDVFGEVTQDDFVNTNKDRSKFLTLADSLDKDMGLFGNQQDKQDFINRYYPLVKSTEEKISDLRDPYSTLKQTIQGAETPESVLSDKATQYYSELESQALSAKKEKAAKIVREKGNDYLPSLTSGEKQSLQTQARSRAWQELNLNPDQYTETEMYNYIYPGRVYETNRKADIVQRNTEIGEDGKIAIPAAIPPSYTNVGISGYQEEQDRMTPEEILNAESIDGLSPEKLLQFKTDIFAHKKLQAEEQHKALNLKANELTRIYEETDPHVWSAYDILDKAYQAKQQGTLNPQQEQQAREAKDYLDNLPPEQQTRIKSIRDAAQDIQVRQQEISTQYPEFGILEDLNSYLQETRDIEQENSTWVGKALVGVSQALGEALPRLGEGLTSTYDSVAANWSESSEAAQILRAEEYVPRTTNRDATVQQRPISEKVLDFKHGPDIYEVSFDANGIPKEVYNKEGNVARIESKTRENILREAASHSSEAKLRVNGSALWNNATDASSDLLGTIALAIPTGGAGAGFRMAEFIPIMLQYTGRTAQQGIKSGLDTDQAMMYGLLGATMEGLTEVVFPFIGRLTGKAESIALKDALRRFVAEGDKEALKKLGTKELFNQVVYAPLGEGSEESLADVLQPIIDQGFNNYTGDNQLQVQPASLKNMAEDFTIGAAVSIIPGFVGGIRNSKHIQSDEALSQSVFSIVNQWDHAKTLYDKFKLDKELYPVFEATRRRTLVDLEDENIPEAKKIEKVAAVFDAEKRKHDADNARTTVHSEEIQAEADKLDERADKILRDEPVDPLEDLFKGADSRSVNNQDETNQTAEKVTDQEITNKINDEVTREFENIDLAIEGAKSDPNKEFEGKTLDELLSERKLLTDDPEAYFVTQVANLTQELLRKDITEDQKDQIREIKDSYEEVRKLYTPEDNSYLPFLPKAAEDLYNKPANELTEEEFQLAKEEAVARESTYGSKAHVDDLSQERYQKNFEQLSKEEKAAIQEDLNSLLPEGVTRSVSNQPDNFITPKAEYRGRIDNLDPTTKQSDITNLAVGDYIAVPPSAKSSGITGFVKKINPKNIIIESLYSPNPDSEGIIQEHTVPKTDVKEFIKPKTTPVSITTPEPQTQIPEPVVANQTQNATITKVVPIGSPKDISASDIVKYQDKDWKVKVKYQDGTLKLQGVENFKEYIDGVSVSELEGKIEEVSTSPVDAVFGDLQVTDAPIQPTTSRVFELLFKRLQKAIKIPVNLVSEATINKTDLPLQRQESLDRSNAVFITRDGSPVGFNYDTELTARERFDISKFKKIGEGSDRVVLDMGNGQVLKVAKTARGLEQNIYEGDWFLTQQGVTPKHYEIGLNYVVSENIPKLKVTDKIPIYDVETGEQIGQETASKMLFNLSKFSQYSFDNKMRGIEDVLKKYGFETVLNYDLLWGDFTALRNWGYKDGKAYHVDGGTFGGTEMLTSYSGVKPLSDPQFREIYYRSRAAKKQYQDTDRFTKFHIPLESKVLFRNKQGIIYGYVKDNQVYLNTDRMNLNTPIHEFGHVWINVMKGLEPRIINAGKSLVKNTKYLNDVLANPAYDVLSEDEKLEEALATAIGDKGEQIIRAASKVKFMSWYRKFWIILKGAMGRFGGRNFSTIKDELFDEMSLDEFTALAAQELLGGNELNQFNNGNGEVQQFQIIGQLGAEALDKAEEATTRLDNLKVARDMEAKGKDAKTIRLATGWELGLDKKWRYEIDDYQLKLGGSLEDVSVEIEKEAGNDFYDPNFSASFPLQDYLEHPELYSAYEEFKNLNVTFYRDSDSFNFGGYSPNTKSIKVNLNYHDKSYGATRSNIAHEVQHIIQGIEDFSSGGDFGRERLHVLRQRGISRSDFSNLSKVEQRAIDLEALDNYEKLVGEVEARNVQKRLNYTQEQRRIELLSETEDVDRNDQKLIQEALDNPTLNLMSRQDPKQVILDNIRNMSDLRNKFTPEEMYQAKKDKFDSFGVTLEDIRDVYNEKVPPATDTGTPFAEVPPTTPVVPESTLDERHFSDIQVIKTPQVAKIFKSKQTLDALNIPYNKKEFIENDPLSEPDIQFEIAATNVTGVAYRELAMEKYGPDPSQWVPSLTAWATSQPDILKTNIILTHLMDYLRFESPTRVDPALIRFVTHEWRRAGSRTSEAFNSRRALRQLQENRERIITNSGLLDRHQADINDLQKALDNADDADLNQFEVENEERLKREVEAVKDISEEAEKPDTKQKQVRGKSKSSIVSKKGLVDKEALAARIRDKQEALKLKCK